MGLFKKVFGGRDPLTQMRRDFSQENWAGAYNAACKLERDRLSPEEQAEVAEIELCSGDRLAEINLFEGEGEINNGNLLRAREHLQLACEQARSDELQQKAQTLLLQVEQGQSGDDLSVSSGGSCSSGCGTTCSPVSDLPAEDVSFDLDDETRFEVLLATLPEKLASRYQAAGTVFQKAWLVSQDDNPRLALQLLQQVPSKEQDALYFYERGSLRGRQKDFKGAHADLQKAIDTEPELFVALNAMVDLLVAYGRLDEVEKLLRQTLAEERFQGFCWANLAQLMAHRGEDEEALELASRALATGRAGQAAVLLSANILEKQERFSEAEMMLAKLPASGGCSPGVNPLLAEFWLRHNKNLDQALETFKAALRQEKDNPRWLLRIGQVYAARGWKKDALGQLERLMGHPSLTNELRREAQATADQLKA